MTDLNDFVNPPAAPAPQQDINPLVQDQAAPILKRYLSAGHINSNDAATAWETFHNSRNPTELAQNLTPTLPSDLKAELSQAKNLYAPPQQPADRAVDAVRHVAKINPNVRETIEKYPHVAKIFNQALTGQKGKE